jgi:gallate dioxygenase
MMRDKLYKDIPGTTLFDADQSRMGYHLNQFCMSLMKPENRERFKADQRAYLDEWPMTEDQKQAVLDLDLNRCIALGGNIYFLAKIGSTFGMSFQQMAGTMTGLSEAAYRDMMVGGGRPVEGNRIKDNPNRDPNRQAPEGHGQVTGAIFSSHVPAMGAAMDLGKTEEPYWKPIFDGYEPTRQWLKENTPDVVFLVYNDHATAFDLSLIPTFAIGTGPSYAVADEGYGPRPVPPIEGDPDLAAHVVQSVIQDDFDLTLVNEMVVDHGLTVPLSMMFGQPDAWPCRVIPFAVNVVQYPIPSGRRCYEIGRAIGRAIRSYPKDVKVQLWGTGGMSHQLQGPRAGLINPEWDNAFLDLLINDPSHLAASEHLEYIEEAGSEGIELVMWLIARGAMADQAVDARADVAPPSIVRRFYHVPASNSAVGHLVLDDTANIPSTVTA